MTSNINFGERNYNRNKEKTAFEFVFLKESMMNITKSDV